MRDRITLYVKTRRFCGDRRVEKEIESLSSQGFDVDLYVASDDEVKQTPASARSFRSLWVPGGAAPDNTLLRVAGALLFSVQAALSAIFRQRDTRYQWVCDPVLFPLVILLKSMTSKKVIWDHHELPPDWIFNLSPLRKLFAYAYEKADIVVHTNSERHEHLENQLKRQAKKSLLLPNYPRQQDMVSADFPAVAENVGNFVYLQNTIGEHRCDLEVFGAIKRSGLKVVYAGQVDEKRLQVLQDELDVESFCVFAGHLSLGAINSLLDRCMMTLIFYKNLSTNNWLCEPNRLYQAMNKRATIVTGNNPLFETLMASYPYGVASATDGSDEESIYQAIQKAIPLAARTRNDREITQPSFLWEESETVFQQIRSLGGTTLEERS